MQDEDHNTPKKPKKPKKPRHVIHWGDRPHPFRRRIPNADETRELHEEYRIDYEKEE